MSKMNFEELRSYVGDVMYTHLPSAPREYEQIVFKLLFLKFLNDRFDEEVEKLVQNKGITKSAARKRKDLFKFYIPKKARWSHIRTQTEAIDKAINKALELIEQENDNTPSGTYMCDPIDQYVSEQSARMLFESVSKKRLRHEDLESPGIIKQVFEQLIRFISVRSAAKIPYTNTSKFDLYTPIKLSRLMVDILEPKSGMDVYDPSIILGSMLVYSHKYVSDKESNPDDIHLCGQYLRESHSEIISMRMILNDIENVNLVQGHPLHKPMSYQKRNLLKFDRVITNPGWLRKFRVNGSDEFEDIPDQYKYGIPRSADWAWVQLVIASTKQTGKSGIVLRPGALYGKGKGAEIRKLLLEDDLIEAIITLPENVLYRTSQQAHILIINKDKPDSRKGNVLFVNAEDQYLPESGVQIYENFYDQRKLTEEGLEKIAGTYKSYAEEPHHSRVVSLNEIEENNWDLRVPKYVDTTWQAGPSWRD